MSSNSNKRVSDLYHQIAKESNPGRSKKLVDEFFEAIKHYEYPPTQQTQQSFDCVPVVGGSFAPVQADPTRAGYSGSLPAGRYGGCCATAVW